MPAVCELWPPWTSCASPSSLSRVPIYIIGVDKNSESETGLPNLDQTFQAAFNELRFILIVLKLIEILGNSHPDWSFTTPEIHCRSFGKIVPQWIVPSLRKPDNSKRSTLTFHRIVQPQKRKSLEIIRPPKRIIYFVANLRFWLGNEEYSSGYFRGAANPIFPNDRQWILRLVNDRNENCLGSQSTSTRLK